MAKITANGDHAIRAWRDPSGCRMVLTHQGRLLRNYLKGDGLVLAGKGYTVGSAEPFAQRLGFERVSV